MKGNLLTDCKAALSNLRLPTLGLSALALFSLPGCSTVSEHGKASDDPHATSKRMLKLVEPARRLQDWADLKTDNVKATETNKAPNNGK